MKNLIILSIAAIILASCSQQLFNFTIVSTKNIEFGKLSSMEKSTKRTTGEDKASIIVVVPTRSIKIDQQSAIP